MLLYATEGAMWQYSSRITYSFVPDGTSIGGISSNLFATLNSQYPTATWEAQIQKAVAMWETYAGVNLAQVSDNGEALGAYGNQQGDPNVGDIRISMAPMGTNGTLAVTFIPPPVNGGTEAGDIVFNSSYPWGINNGNYDIETVAIHELGHSLGLGESTVTGAAMYGYYNGVNVNPTADDQAGVRSLYGAYPAPIGTNHTEVNATNLTSLIVNNQYSTGGLYVSGVTDVDWFTVTVPSTTNGTATISVQSTNLSSLSPRLMVYQGTNTRTPLGSAMLSNQWGATATVTLSGVYSGEVLSFRASAASSPGAYGSYGLLVNFGSGTQAPVAPPNTVVPWAPGTGGGTQSSIKPHAITSQSGEQGGWWSGQDRNQTIHIGSLSGYGQQMFASPLSVGPIKIGWGPIDTNVLVPVSRAVSSTSGAVPSQSASGGSTTLSGGSSTLSSSVISGAVAQPAASVLQSASVTTTGMGLAPTSTVVTPSKRVSAKHTSSHESAKTHDAALAHWSREAHAHALKQASVSSAHHHYSRR